MKKIIISLLVSALLMACNNGDSGKSKTGGTDITKDPAYQRGFALVSKNDCFTCHKIDDPFTGPPYRDVANKYAGQPDTIVNYLAHKVITGGGGTWGQIPMTPHQQVSEEDAKSMVEYILLLKK